jgi:hypothetical protein
MYKVFVLFFFLRIMGAMPANAQQSNTRFQRTGEGHSIHSSRMLHSHIASASASHWELEEVQERPLERIEVISSPKSQWWVYPVVGGGVGVLAGIGVGWYRCANSDAILCVPYIEMAVGGAIGIGVGALVGGVVYWSRRK